MTEGRAHPQFIIELPERELKEAEGITHAEAIEEIRQVEHGIRDDPHGYWGALRALGKAAGAGTLDFDRPIVEAAGIDPTIGTLVTGYFRHRLDSHVEFDKPTEAALAENRQHADLVGQSRSAVRYRIRLTDSDMSHTMRTPRDAEQLRDAARISRLAGYVEEVIRWQQEHHSSGDE